MEKASENYQKALELDPEHAPTNKEMTKLNKLINVIKVFDFTDTAFVQREMALIKVFAKPENRAEILRMVDIFRSRVVDVGADYYTVEMTGDEDKVTAFLNLLKPMGIKEIARTGAIALAREKNKA